MNPERTFSPLIDVKITSNKNGKHCDLYPYGSFHRVKKCQDGHLWLPEGGDSIPDHFETQEIPYPVQTKQCLDCKNHFEKNHPFISDNIQETCIRCYERKYLPNRDEYRKAIQSELGLKWISVKHHLPKPLERVLWVLIKKNSKDKTVISDYIFGEQERLEYGIHAHFLWSSEAVVISEEQNQQLGMEAYVTHWMPLPKTT